MSASDHETIEAFSALLEEPKKEQVYQQFLEQHSRMIPQEFVQNHGIHFSLVFRKLRLAETYTTDFFYLAKSSADWNAVFIELEKPHSRFFKEGEDNFSPDFLDGLSQMNRWRAWVETRGNMDHLLSETLDPVFQPHAMRSNPVYPHFVLVTGRRAELRDDRRRALVRAQERSDFKIITYDSLLDGYASNEELYVAVRTNSHVDVQTKTFVDEALLAWVEPSRLRISKSLHQDAMKHRDEWRIGFKDKTLDRTLQQISVRAEAADDKGEAANSKSEVSAD